MLSDLHMSTLSQRRLPPPPPRLRYLFCQALPAGRGKAASPQGPESKQQPAAGGKRAP